MRYLDVDGFPRISKIGLGCWQFGAKEWGYGEHYADTEAKAIVRRALELGVTLFDTAEVYGRGRSETILGAALGADRDREDLVVASKHLPVLPLPGIMERRARASAKRLGVAHMDLYQLHWPNPVVPLRLQTDGLRRLQAEGLIREVGVSNYSLERWRAAEGFLGTRVLSNQVNFSLAVPGPDRDLAPWAADHQRVVIAYSPLAQGLLGGKYDASNRPTDVRRNNSLFLPDNMARAERLLRTLREVADAHAVTPSQVALAWLLHRPAVVAIPGASSVAQLEANAAAAEVLLTADQDAALTTAAREFAPVRGVAAVPKLAADRLHR